MFNKKMTLKDRNIMYKQLLFEFGENNINNDLSYSSKIY